MNPALPFLLLGAHLFGDFVLQNGYMAENKAKDSCVCVMHVVTYMLSFIFLIAWFDLPLWAYYSIGVQHYFQDRYALHLKWMKFWEQTPVEKWPTGPLCVDQAMRIGFIAMVVAFI